MRIEVAHGVHRDLRVVRAGLDADVAAGTRRVELVAAGTPGRSASAAGRRSRRGRACRRTCWPKPIVTVSDDGGRPSASPVSSGGASGLRGRPRRSRRASRAPGSSARRRVVHCCSMRWTSRPLPVVVRSSATKCSRSCDGRDDPGLVRAVERRRRPAPETPPGRRAGRARSPTPRRHRRRRRPPRPPEQAAAGDASGHRRPPFAASWRPPCEAAPTVRGAAAVGDGRHVTR